MRDIKFRGKTTNGQWVTGLVSVSHGYPGQPVEGTYISNTGGMPWAFLVRPETVGEYTCLKDKNGREIYEGDIISVKFELYESHGSKLPAREMRITRKFAIQYHNFGWHLAGFDGAGSYELKDYRDGYSWGNGIEHYWFDGKYFDRLSDFEIIGNIYENPELLK